MGTVDERVMPRINRMLVLTGEKAGRCIVLLHVNYCNVQSTIEQHSRMG